LIGFTGILRGATRNWGLSANRTAAAAVPPVADAAEKAAAVASVEVSPHHGALTALFGVTLLFRMTL
jgi:hypothetical protein